jgi:HK97 family phage major capsid protein
MGKTPEEMAQDINTGIEALKTKVDNAVSKEDFAVIKTELEAMKQENADLQLKETLDELTEKVNQLKENAVQTEKVNLSFKEQIKAQIKEKQDEFKALKTDKTARFGFTIKAVGDMLISTNTTGRVARTEVDPMRARIVRRKPFILDLVNVGSTTANTMYWIEQTAPEGTPAMTAEGATKAQVDWNYVENSAPVRKMTAFVKASKEMLDDVDGFAQDIADELTERVLLLADAQILTGDGTGQNLEGIAENATPFAAGGLANTVAAANDTDVLRAALAQVDRQFFDPNVIVIHPDKAAVMDLQKGSDNHYLLPPFVTADGLNIRGVRVVTNTGVGADDFYAGDLSKYKFKLREGISIDIGYDGNDWTKNMVTPLAEMRGVGYIPANHYGAIVKGTFTVAKALLDPAVADA